MIDGAPNTITFTVTVPAIADRLDCDCFVKSLLYPSLHISSSECPCVFSKRVPLEQGAGHTEMCWPLMAPLLCDHLPGGLAFIGFVCFFLFIAAGQMDKPGQGCPFVPCSQEDSESSNYLMTRLSSLRIHSNGPRNPTYQHDKKKRLRFFVNLTLMCQKDLYWEAPSKQPQLCSADITKVHHYHKGRAEVTQAINTSLSTTSHQKKVVVSDNEIQVKPVSAQHWHIKVTYFSL